MQDTHKIVAIGRQRKKSFSEKIIFAEDKGRVGTLGDVYSAADRRLKK